MITYNLVKFIYSEKATKCGEISIVHLTITTENKFTLEISQNLVAFSEYMNFMKNCFYIFLIWPILEAKSQIKSEWIDEFIIFQKLTQKIWGISALRVL